MAVITSGDAYVDTDVGTNDSSHGLGTGTNACLTLAYMLSNRTTSALTGNLTIHCKGATISIITCLVMLSTIVFSAGTSEGKIKAMDRMVDKSEQCIDHINEVLKDNAVDIGVIKAAVLRIEEKVE